MASANRKHFFAFLSSGHTHIVEYLIGIPQLFSRKERIDALELLGSTYVDKKRDMIGALQFWKRAMDERYISNISVSYLSNRIFYIERNFYM